MVKKDANDQPQSYSGSLPSVGVSKNRYFSSHVIVFDCQTPEKAEKSFKNRVSFILFSLGYFSYLYILIIIK